MRRNINMAGIAGKIIKVKAQSESDYKEDGENVGQMLKEYEDVKDQYNAQMLLINQERLSLRDEIHKLYGCLATIDESLDEKKRYWIIK